MSAFCCANGPLGSGERESRPSGPGGALCNGLVYVLTHFDCCRLVSRASEQQAESLEVNEAMPLKEGPRRAAGGGSLGPAVAIVVVAAG